MDSDGNPLIDASLLVNLSESERSEALAAAAAAKRAEERAEQRALQRAIERKRQERLAEQQREHEVEAERLKKRGLGDGSGVNGGDGEGENGGRVKFIPKKRRVGITRTNGNSQTNVRKIISDGENQLYRDI